MINKIKELQDKFKWLSMRTDLQSKQIDQNNPVTRGSTALVPINTTCLDCDTSLEICTCMDDTIDIKEALLQMRKTPMTFIPDEVTFSKEEVLELMYEAFRAGFKKYDVVEAGLEGLETEIECNWIFEKYNKI